MPSSPSLAAGDNAFPEHVFNILGEQCQVLEKRIGGSVMVVAGRPQGGQLVLMTAGASRLPLDGGLPVELAVEVTPEQQGAGFYALKIVCDDIFKSRRTPPLETPWRNREPILTGTQITAIALTGSRWGASFDEVRDASGELVGHVRTLRLLTDSEAAVVQADGWASLVERVGSQDALIDVERASTIAAGDKAPPAARENRPVILSKLHEQYPPRWVTLNTNGRFHSVTGHESQEYMDDPANHEVWGTNSFTQRFPWTERFIDEARPEQTARFDDSNGDFVIEQD